MERIDNYLETLYLAEDLEVFQEGITDAIKKFTANKVRAFVKNFKSAVDSNNIKKAKQVAKATGLGKVKPGAVDSYMKSQSSDYATVKTLASKVLKNSLQGNPKVKTIDRAATYIAVRSLMATKKGVLPKPLSNGKKYIKEFVATANKYYDDYDQQADEAEKEGKAPPIPRDSIPDYVVGAVIVVGFTTIAGAATFWLYHHLAFFLILIITVIGVLAAMGSLAGIVIAKGGEAAAAGGT